MIAEVPALTQQQVGREVWARASPARRPALRKKGTSTIRFFNGIQ